MRAFRVLSHTLQHLVQFPIQRAPFPYTSLLSGVPAAFSSYFITVPYFLLAFSIHNLEITFFTGEIFIEGLVGGFQKVREISVDALAGSFQELLQGLWLANGVRTCLVTVFLFLFVLKY